MSIDLLPNIYEIKLLKSKEPLAEESVIRFFDISAIGKPIQMDPRRRVESTQNLERLPNMIVTVAWIDVKPLHINVDDIMELIQS